MTETSARTEDAVDDRSRYVEELRQALRDALDAIVWMSGSPSFGPDGEAHEGWVKVRDQMDPWFELAKP
jgi:hypothetical protein